MFIFFCTHWLLHYFCTFHPILAPVELIRIISSRIKGITTGMMLVIDVYKKMQTQIYRCKGWEGEGCPWYWESKRSAAPMAFPEQKPYRNFTHHRPRNLKNQLWERHITPTHLNTIEQFLAHMFWWYFFHFMWVDQYFFSVVRNPQGTVATPLHDTIKGTQSMLLERDSFLTLWLQEAC